MKKQRKISIKARLLGSIMPVVIAIVAVLVLIAYQASAGIIEDYSQNLLESSVSNQSSKIEAWLSENLASFQMAKTTIENLHPDDTQLKAILDGYYNYNDNYPDGLYVSVFVDRGCACGGGSDSGDFLSGGPLCRSF